MAAIGDVKEPPRERLIFPAGEFRTTKGTFIFDRQAADQVMADWAEWTGGLPQKGSADYEHDQSKEELPGHLKLDSASYDLELRQGALWAVNINWTAMAAQMIVNREKRFTSPWWLFERATKRICRYLNFGLVSLPATLGQAELVAASASETSKAAVSFYGYAIESETASVVADETGSAVPHREYPLDPSPTWDGDAARERLKKWADGDWDKYALGFAYVKGQGGVESAYLLPHHDVKDGHLVTVWGGVKAAGNAIMGARAKVSIPADDLPKVKAHLAAHYHEFKRLAPWETKKAGILDDEEDALHAPEVAAVGEFAAKDPTKIQTLIFAKSVFTEAEAKAWAKKHDFKSGDVDETEDSFRLRQRDPGEFQKGSFRTITLTDGVKAVIGRPKAETAAMADYKDPKFDATRHAYALRYMASTAMENMMAAIHLHNEVPMLADAMELPKHTAAMAEHVMHCAAAMRHHMDGKASADADDMDDEGPDMDGASVAKLPADLKAKVDAAVAACKAAKLGGLLQKANQAALASVGAKVFTKSALASLRGLGGLAASVATVTGEKSPEAAGAKLLALSRDLPALQEQTAAAEAKAAAAQKNADAVKYDALLSQNRNKVPKGSEEEWVRANVHGSAALETYLAAKKPVAIATTHTQPETAGNGGNIASAIASLTDPKERDKVIEAVELTASELAGWAQTGGGMERLRAMQEQKAKALGLIL